MPASASAIGDLLLRLPQHAARGQMLSAGGYPGAAPCVDVGDVLARRATPNCAPRCRYAAHCARTSCGDAQRAIRASRCSHCRHCCHWHCAPALLRRMEAAPLRSVLSRRRYRNGGGNGRCGGRRATAALSTLWLEHDLKGSSRSRRIGRPVRRMRSTMCLLGVVCALSWRNQFDLVGGNQMQDLGVDGAVGVSRQIGHDLR